MGDTLTPLERSKRMALIGGKNTGPEWIVRRMIHAMGFRYRLHGKCLPGCPNLVFAGCARSFLFMVVFGTVTPIQTASLHACPNHALISGKRSWERTANAIFGTSGTLSTAGWKVMVVWECELRHKEQLENRLKQFLREGACEPLSFSPELGASASE